MTSMTAMAATGKTVTFHGGHIYKDQNSESGTAQVKITNVTKTQKNVKLNNKTVKEYIDTKELGDTPFYCEDGSVLTAKEIATSEEGITVYYTSKAPVTVTASSALTCFWACYPGTVQKTDYTPKYYSFNDYLSKENEAKVLSKKPNEDYLFAPGTQLKINKPGKYLFIVKDDGMISDTPFSAFCVIVK